MNMDARHMRIALPVDQAKIDCMNDLCEYDQDPEGNIYFDEEALFPNGNRMAIQVIAGSRNPFDEWTDPAWTQGVLFSPDGEELGCTEVGDCFDGEYEIEYEGVKYIVDVIAEK